MLSRDAIQIVCCKNSVSGGVMRPIMECVPNFSEGRRQDVITAILQAVQAHDRVQLLHHTSDPDHNRTVVTFAGAPDATMNAAFDAIQIAAEGIDMDVHRGVHPRLGAADVVPFVPLQGLTLADCAACARKLGQRVGDELNLPVYLYGAAAIRPERENLADIRRGEYEKLKQTITDPDHYPDYGPARVGKAGATVIGARQALIAFNIYLTTDDVRIARHIARAIRFSSGGLAGVKALGLLVGGMAQVSMNLTNYQRTPIYRVVELVRAEAARFGVAIARSELIGMIPQDALLDTAAWYLQLHQFDSTQVIENQLKFD